MQYYYLLNNSFCAIIFPYFYMEFENERIREINTGTKLKIMAG